MGVVRIFSRGESREFSRNFFPGGSKSGEICFLPFRNWRNNLSLLITSKSRGGKAPFRRSWVRVRVAEGGAMPRGEALLVKRRNSRWSFPNEPEVRFRFYILVKVGPTIRLSRTVPVCKISRNFTSVKFSNLTPAWWCIVMK